MAVVEYKGLEASTMADLNAQLAIEVADGWTVEGSISSSTTSDTKDTKKDLYTLLLKRKTA